MIQDHSHNSYRCLSLFIIFSIPISVVFFLIPSEIYYPQRILWGESKELPLLFISVGSALFLLLLPFFYLIYRYSINTAKNLSLYLFGIGLYVLLADVFAPLQSSPLDGFQLSSKEPLYLTCIEITILLLLLIIGFWKGKNKTLNLAHTISLALWIVSISYSAIIFFTNESTHAQKTKIEYRSDLKNIYHFVLDELQTDVALSVIKDLKLKKKFEGFTFFPFNSSSYLFTKSSFPNYMSSTTYSDKEPFQDWLEVFKRQGIIKSLKEYGYQITMNAPWTIWDNDYTSGYNTLDKIMQKSLMMNYPGMGDFFPIWFARISPNFLTNEAFKVGAGLEKKLSRVLERDARYPRTIGEGREPFSSVMMLKKAIRDEHKFSPQGRYTYLHAVLPHGPYVMDGHCRYSKRFSQGDVKAYYQQAVCGLKLVTQFLRELKKLKRFNDSIIILHADTGHGMRGLISVDGKKIISSEKIQKKSGDKIRRYPDWNEHQVTARTLSFLSIKPPQAHGPIVLSPKQSKLIDLFPTLMSLVGVKVDQSSIEGISLVETNDNLDRRENSFFLYDPRDKNPTITRYTWNKDSALTHLNKILTEFNSGQEPTK